MENARLVRALLPVYGGDSFLAEAIQSALKQTHRPIQLIIVDYGSTDLGGEIAHGFAEVEYHRKENGGVARARHTEWTSRTNGSF